jgi:DNA uptake protein ComE-like DNA-binding protein
MLKRKVKIINYRFGLLLFAARGRLLYLILSCFLLPIAANAQTPESPATTTEQQLENITENNEDAETEDDAYLQQMSQYIKNPINLNTADENGLKELRILNPIQIQNLISYRNLFGKFIDIYELQAIPNWTVELIKKIKPYVSVADKIELINSISYRLKGGEHSILLRVTQTLEKSKGFLIDSSSATNFYPGSSQKILLRYKYQFKNLLQYGIVGEKDAGEQFFKGKQKQGFDFYSAHFFARNMGIVKSLALGDFTVNLGQGLTQWQSLAFKKSADVINIKREAEVLRPYNSAGEINFHRGAGITISKNKWAATVFASYKKIDANFVADTSQTQEDFISSLQTSGYHRTKSETADKGIQTQLSFGGNISYQYKRLHIGINGIQYKFKLPLKKSGDPYNLYAPAGKSFGNYSMDYSYTYKNLHFFGEAAAANNFYKAFINGILISAAPAVDISFLYRNISSGYQSLYTSAFTENTFPTNEKGFYSGISIHPGSTWRLDAYADFYKFPWLKFRVDVPSNGSDYLLQLTYKPNKQFEIYSRFRSGAKAINTNPDQLTLSPVVAQPKQTWRTQFSYQIKTSVTLRNRVEMLWFNKRNTQPEQGFLTYFDFLYEPMLQPWSGSIRLQYFETDSYNSRLYAYENDVLYSFSIPVFYDKGLRYYLNANYDINKKLTVWVKWAQTIYKNKTLIGSGLDEIKGNKKSEIKLQVMYRL